jgi:putative glutamine amidotransferase
MRQLLRNIILSSIILAGTTIYSDGQVRIAVSKTSDNYEAWLHGADPYSVIVDMYGMTIDSALFVLSTCQGLLLTGGGDVNPAYYGKSNELSKCKEIDNYRDSLELALINQALFARMPVFGICRGEQILNVALGGSLLTDIPADAGTKVTHDLPADSKDPMHSIKIDPQSDLYQLAGIEKGIVNSSHHQSVDIIAGGMKISASSEDGVVEAIEREFPIGKSYIMAVQWHPERLDKNPDLSRPLADKFLEQINKYKQDRKHLM